MEIRLTANHLVNYKEAGRMLGVSRQTIHNWIKEGKFRLIEIGDRRYLILEEVENMVLRRKKGG